VGLVFLLMVMFAPGGVASLIMMNVRVALFGKIKRFYLLYVGLFVGAAVMLAGAAAIVEMIYHMQLNAALGPMVPFAGLQLDTSSTTSWVVAAALLAVGLGIFEVVRRRFAQAWGKAQEEIEAEIKRREVA
jgi:branched-chain amino acid transport system permease protein